MKQCFIELGKISNFDHYEYKRHGFLRDFLIFKYGWCYMTKFLWSNSFYSDRGQAWGVLNLWLAFICIFNVTRMPIYFQSEVPEKKLIFFENVNPTRKQTMLVMYLSEITWKSIYILHQSISYFSNIHNKTGIKIFQCPGNFLAWQ